MYVTRPLSMYRRNPEAIADPPPEGPNSGYLVLQDEGSEGTRFFGLFPSRRIREFPFPQNKLLKTRYSTGAGENNHVSIDYVFLIPVINQPLAFNRYYPIVAHGRHKGEAYTNSSEEDATTCCFCNFVRDVKPEPLHHQDIYQQVEISYYHWRGFTAKSVAPDGYPPNFLRRKGWEIYTSNRADYELNEAPGLNPILRAQLPDFNFPLSDKTFNSVVVGKWYCPFMFIKEGSLKDQLERTMFYEMTLEQRWEQIFSCENTYNNESNIVVVDVVVPKEVVCIGGREAMVDEKNVVDGVMWFKCSSNVQGEMGVGLSLAIIERMKWEQKRVGFVGGSETKVQVKRVEELGKVGEWRKFGCYVLAERFVLRRFDGSLVLTYDFKHTHQIKSKWE